MEVKALKLNLLQRILGVSDPRLLQKINQVLDKEMVVGYTIDGLPLTLNEYQERLKKAEKEFEKGDTMTQDQIEQESGKW